MNWAQINPSQHFVYQRVHTLAGKPLHLDQHLDLLARSFQHVYGGERLPLEGPASARGIASEIASKLQAARFPPKGSATTFICLTPSNNEHTLTITPERVLLDRGYAHSSLRPQGVTFEYSVPFGGFPTQFQLSAAALFDTLATARLATEYPNTHTGRSARAIRRQGELLLSCGDAPLFAVRGRTIFTPGLLDGAIDSVERSLVIDSVSKHNTSHPPRSQIRFSEESILHSELTSLDELFFADAAGITSFSGCDSAKFMSLIAPRLASLMG